MVTLRLIRLDFPIYHLCDLSARSGNSFQVTIRVQSRSIAGASRQEYCRKQSHVDHELSGGIILNSTNFSNTSRIDSMVSTCPCQPNLRALSILVSCQQIKMLTHDRRLQTNFVAHDQDIVSENCNAANIPSPPSNGLEASWNSSATSFQASRFLTSFDHSTKLKDDLQTPFGPYPLGLKGIFVSA